MELTPKKCVTHSRRIVESVGSEVAELKAGDHVIPQYMAECKECELCHRGKNNIYQVFRFNFISRIAYTDKKMLILCQGKPICHKFGLSTFSEYNPEAPLRKICLLGCEVSAGSIVIHSPLKYT